MSVTQQLFDALTASNKLIYKLLNQYAELHTENIMVICSENNTALSAAKKEGLC